jgi:hypothetical protein
MQKHIPLKRLLIIFPILFFSLNIFSQQTDTLLARLITNLRTFYEMNPDEKCYAHLDKSFYQPGETVFLKAYLTLNNAFSTLSNVVYTDMSDAGGRLLHKAMWKAENGTANASIFLPDTLSTGLYRIRCYSLWMLNQPHTINEQYIFVQGRKDQSKSFITSPTALNAKFYPEGGQLIVNVVNRVAFRIHDAHQLPPVGVKAVLIDEAGSTVAEPLVFENGIGLVEFTPQSGKKYRLQITSDKITGQQFQLPAARTEGINLKAENLSPTKVFIQANATDQFIDQNKTVYMLAQQNGKTVALQQLNLADMQNATVINKKNLQQGMMQVTLFSEQLQPLAERWIWVQLPAAGSLELNTSALSFMPKSKNTFSISFSGVDTPQLSVSVVPADLPAYSFINTPDIQTYQMLHSNETGPHFVLPSLQKIKAEDYSKFIDAVTLTMQPSGFNWQQIKNGTLEPLNYFFETGISLRGMVKLPKEQLQVEKTKVEIIIKDADSTTTLINTAVSDSGAFAINDLQVSKSANIFVRSFIQKGKKSEDLKFELLPSYIDTLKAITLTNYQIPILSSIEHISETQKNFITNYSLTKGKELKEIIIRGRKNKLSKEDSLTKKYASDIYKDSEFTILPDSNANYATIWEMLQELVPGLNVINPSASEIQNVSTDLNGFTNSSADFGMMILTFNRYSLSNDRISVQGGQSNRPDIGIALFLNEIPVLNSEINFINPADVVMIKVNRMPRIGMGGFGMNSGAEGSILIYTKKKNIKSNFTNSQITGYSRLYKFSNIDYSNNQYDEFEDRRTTLLWQPQVQFGADGKAVIHFFNNSYTTKYKIIIQGIDKKGTIYFIEKTVE